MKIACKGTAFLSFGKVKGVEIAQSCPKRAHFKPFVQCSSSFQSLSSRSAGIGVFRGFVLRNCSFVTPNPTFVKIRLGDNACFNAFY